MWENSCGGHGSGGTQTGSKDWVVEGSRDHSLAASWLEGWELLVTVREHSAAFASSGALSVGLYGQRRKINKSVPAYRTPYGSQTVRQALGAGSVLFRLSLGIFFFKLIPIFFPPSSFSLVFIPYMVISISLLEDSLT